MLAVLKPRMPSHRSRCSIAATDGREVIMRTWLLVALSVYALLALVKAIKEWQDNESERGDWNIFGKLFAFIAAYVITFMFLPIAAIRRLITGTW